VLFHDAVRPLIDPRIITDCVRPCTAAAVDVAILSADTVIAADDADVITEILPRAAAPRPDPAGVPVVRHQARLRARPERPDFATRPATDDCGWCPLPAWHPDPHQPGSEHNMKLTHPVDVHIADKRSFPTRTTA
jgi:2-C-methyl-D-erythritol 4-phosphate cytidylyltransferase